MEIYSEFRKRDDIERLISLIKNEAEEKINIMEICGGHTHSIMKYGLNILLKDKINFLHGPGCPVCVMPVKRINTAIGIAGLPDVIFTAFGDMMRVPGTESSLLKERAKSKDIRMVYSPLDVLKIAENSVNRNKKVVFLAIGFETTTPMTAALLSEVIDKGLSNVFFYVNHVLVPPPIEAILDSGVTTIDGFICPGHVSVVTGSSIYGFIPLKYKKSAVISGFEPYDLLSSVLMIARQIKDKNPKVEIAYKRAVKEDGNKKARDIVNKFFEVAEEFEWRGIGSIPKSGLKLKDEFKNFDAEYVFRNELKDFPNYSDNLEKACKCGDILRGVLKPFDCSLFGTACSPDNPFGACMVSNEGACAAYYKYQNIN